MFNLSSLTMPILHALPELANVHRKQGIRLQRLQLASPGRLHKSVHASNPTGKAVYGA